MKFAIFLLILFTGKNALSQDWHGAKERLVPPLEKHGYHMCVTYIDRHDTIPCIYIVKGSSRRLKGYKFVYVQNGYYIDDNLTYQALYDEQLHRIKNVRKYYFN
ncbi:MAG TPA: hypothetical protein VGM31_19030 [Puia sp.]|jgi:hypothetical protein